MSHSIVRDAFVASVAYDIPPVSRASSHVSTVPAASSPRSACRRAPGTWFSSQAILGPLKYASATSPVRCRIAAPQRASSNAHAAAVRRHCQLTAGPIGANVARSHTTTVSR